MQKVESEIDSVANSDEDNEWAEVSSWNRETLIGDSADRKRLYGMSELEREMELAERRKKVDWGINALSLTLLRSELS